LKPPIEIFTIGKLVSPDVSREAVELEGKLAACAVVAPRLHFSGRLGWLSIDISSLLHLWGSAFMTVGNHQSNLIAVSISKDLIEA
jgi:hypothetical protein